MSGSPGRGSINVRRGEVAHFEEWFRSRNYEIVNLPQQNYFEGEGDLIMCADIVFAGCPIRSSRIAHRRISEMIQRHVRSHSVGFGFLASNTQKQNKTKDNVTPTPNTPELYRSEKSGPPNPPMTPVMAPSTHPNKNIRSTSIPTPLRKTAP